jgi:hypothetical protein
MKNILLENDVHVPTRYIPRYLNKTDTKKQKTYLKKSRKLYKKHIYYQRPNVASFKSLPSPHVKNAMAMYNVENVMPTADLAKKTKCYLRSLKKIVNKGRGAYYSSGSRPNQTPDSWGIARLASAITGGNSSIVDYHILYNGCSPDSKALTLATQTCKRQGKCKKYLDANKNNNKNSTRKIRKL